MVGLLFKKCYYIRQCGEHVILLSYFLVSMF